MLTIMDLQGWVGMGNHFSPGCTASLWALIYSSPPFFNVWKLDKKKVRKGKERGRKTRKSKTNSLFL